MAAVTGILKHGEYFDSVSLMRIAKEVNALAGVADSAVVMGTAENRAILRAAGLWLAEFERADDTDLLIAVQARDAGAAEAAIAQVEELLSRARRPPADEDGAVRPRSLEGALEVLPDANLALVSVAGRYAGGLAMRALRRGLHVMLFSDNVPLATEIALKSYARDQGLLVMGPDCGTAIINGVPLAFANVVRRGAIGIVAASGTGLQEVSCLISHHGEGISQALGTGGRDVKQEVGGIMFVEALRALAADARTRVIVLVAKPPHPEVVARIGAAVAETGKPAVAVFLGAAPAALRAHGIHAAATLEAGALMAVALARGEDPARAAAALAERDLRPLAREQAARLAPTQRFVRGLMSGGTFSSEAQLVLGRRLALAELHANAPVSGVTLLPDARTSTGHTLVDLGADEFTVGRPHPMIDFTLRNERILEEARDPATAVLLLDVVLGYGAHPAPLAELAPVLRAARDRAAQDGRSLPVVCSVTGTDQDPQHRGAVVAGLRETGAVVMESNAAACDLAALIVPEGAARAEGGRP